jgi:FimV-like protein
MQIITPAGVERNNAKIGTLLILALCVLCGLRPISCLAQASEQVEQIERLMQQQMQLQRQHAQQISGLQQQVQEQAVLNATQDWHWVMIFIAVLLSCMALGFLKSRWPMWLAKCREALHHNKIANLAARDGALNRKPQADFSASHMGYGQSIDQSELTGPGMLARLLKRRAQHRSSLVQDSQPDSPWSAPESVLDDADSQVLADEALREFELRRTVGLLPDTQPAVSEQQTANQESAHQMEAAWAAMEEVPLPSTDTNAASEPASGAALVNVSAEVQRVRKSLQQRRVQRDLDLTLPAPSEPIAPEIQRPEQPSAPAPTPLLTPIAIAQAEPRTPIQPVQAEIAPNAASLLSPIEFSFPASQRNLSESEVRLALAQEFRRMGQIEEAATLAEEVISLGNESEQRSARLLLSSLPGH